MYLKLFDYFQIAPPPSMQDDFVYHWKMIKKFYLNRNLNEKVSIESTNIEAHLDQVLKVDCFIYLSNDTKISPSFFMSFNKL